jgi:hypothetical protein
VIFARVIALFMFVWPYVRSHILCMQLVICLLSHFIHIWHIWIKCNKRQMTSCVHKMCERTYGQTNMKRATYNSRKNQPSVKSAHIIPIYGWLIFARVITLFMFVWPYVRSHILCSNKHEKGYLQLSQKSTIREIGIICACSDHGQPRYQI